MASGINKIHQPGTCSASKAARSSSAEECSQEMHMKMCKKIAQLTKVIYALNTKNDEHEASIQALREAHEEEIQHILAETRETILQCKSKVEEEQLLRKHIQALEIAVEQHKRLKEEALAELMLCKKQVEEREPRTQIKQVQTVLSVDTDFENKLLHLSQESDGLVNECKASRRQNIDEKVILDEKYSVEGQPLINEMKNLKSENQRASEEYTQKTSKLQASCEKEKETLKKATQQSMIETKNCQQREMEQRKSSEAEKGFLLQQVKKLEADLEEKNQKINEMKKHSQKLKERIQVAQLKQILDQQASNFKESLKKHSLQSNKEKEKLLQDLQNIIKENQNVKLQLEASHQKVLKMLEKSKNQELKETEERLKKEFNETFKSQHQSHRLEIQTLEEKAKKELHDELEQIQKQQTALLGSLRMELSEQQTLCTNLRKQIEELQMELRSVRTLKKQQARIQFLLHCHVVFCKSSSIKFLSSEIIKEGSSQSQIRSFHEELEKCQSEISELKKENLLLKDTMELLSPELKSQKEEAVHLQDSEKQPRRLKELEEKSRKWESRSEDAHLISCLQDKLSEKEEIIKQLAEGRKCQHSHLANNESYRNRSFSFNPNRGCSTPSMKKKKTIEAPSRVVSVPNLASYAKSFLSCDLRSKRSAPQITKSTSLDRSPGCLRVGFPSAQSSDSSAATRAHGSELPQTKDDQKEDSQHQEWFTKYFSF
ncbi:protein FAM184B isoform X3 [Pezoporus flaviventris]|uniref:protein FAM184B isoform X3 n=1 Tax=Pezoporus flaviventris TaxID=889875 RepID=UPI002AB085A4|nr:protein FAM184B isoform X3 [Pezoporus flaviventris]